MNKSTTNRDFVGDPGPIVSRAELGQRVLVNGHFGGVLRYLGPVSGAAKQGIFCGVELDQRVGKNDGTHQGTFYFQCRPGHGVFAPCHKVQIEEGQAGAEEEAKTRRKAQNELLSRSAMPALHSSQSPAAVPGPLSQPPPFVGQPAPMDWSLMSMSTGSTNSGGSSMTKFLVGDDDAMAHSQATYTVFESDCLMLSDLELSESGALLGLDGDEEEEDAVAEQGRRMMEEWAMRNMGGGGKRPLAGHRLDESIILDGPTLGMPLPVIGSPVPPSSMPTLLDGETPTPMAEGTNFAMALWKREEEEADRRNRNHLALDGLAREKRGEEGVERKKGSGMAATTPTSKSPNNNSAGGGGGPLVSSRRKSGRGGGEDVRNNNGGENDEDSGTTASIASSASPQARGKGRMGSREGRMKPARVSVFQSIPMPAQNLSAAARSKPKAPTKAQLVMEQLKASMEAERQRPKKEIRSKVGCVASSPTTVVVKQKGVEEEEERAEEQGQLTPETPPSTNQQQPQMFRSKSKQSLDDKTPLVKAAAHQKSGSRSQSRTKTVAPSASRPVSTQRTTTTKNATGAGVSSSIPPTATTKSTATGRQVLSAKENTAAASKPASATSLVRKLSRNGGGIGRLFNNSKAAAAKTAPVGPAKTTADPRAKTKQLLQANAASSAGINRILSSHLVYQASIADQQMGELRQLLCREERQHEDKLKEVQEANELERTSAIQKVELAWRERFEQAEERHSNETGQLRADLTAAHQNEIQNERAQHQKAAAELNGQLEMARGELKEQARIHKIKMTETESARNGRLNDELASLQYALQLKKDEVQEVRKQNRELIVQTERMAEKEAQIVKMGKKNEDLKEEVNRLKQIEKNLIAQLNEYRRELEESRSKGKEMEKEREILEYHLQEQLERSQEFPTTPMPKIGGPKLRDCSPSAVSVRTPEQQRRQSSERRPNSSCWPSHGRFSTTTFASEDGDMSRSMDSAMSQSVINCYRQGARTKSQNTPNKVYTPREAYELNDPPPSARRFVDFDEHAASPLLAAASPAPAYEEEENGPTNGK